MGTTNNIVNNLIDPSFYVAGGGLGTTKDEHGNTVQRLGFENLGFLVDVVQSAYPKSEKRES